MAKDKKDKGVTQVERVDVEQQPTDDGAGESPPTGEHVAPADLMTTEAPQDEPGPEDFERHSGARLLEDHARDLVLLDDVERRIKNRGPVIASRVIKSGGKNPVVKIGDRVFAPRKRTDKAGGGIGLAEVGPRSEASID